MQLLSKLIVEYLEKTTTEVLSQRPAAKNKTVSEWEDYSF